MAYSKKKSPKRTRYTKNEKFNLISYNLSRRVILSVIGLSGLVVILAALAQLFLTPENAIKNQITSISRDYYENYFYESIISANQTPVGTMKASLEDIMSRYETPGFASVPLRQLLLYDNAKYASITASMSAHCDLDKTSIKIYPVPPFNKTDYRIDYHYTCDF